MRSGIFMLLGFFLAACSAPPLSLPTAAPSQTSTSSPLPPTAMLTPSSTATFTLTVTISSTPSETPTSLPTQTPTGTPNLYAYVFPIQPPELAAFSRGGHPYPATDIFAPIGTKFVAVTNGTVDEVSYVDKWNPATNDNSTAGGLSVRILGDDGRHYYGAHLSAIARGIRPGVWVAAGQLLGLVGNTGDARFTTPHLHFEISSPDPPFTKVDPFPLLTAWLNGQDVTPPLPTP